MRFTSWAQGKRGDAPRCVYTGVLIEHSAVCFAMQVSWLYSSVDNCILLGFSLQSQAGIRLLIVTTANRSPLSTDTCGTSPRIVPNPSHSSVEAASFNPLCREMEAWRENGLPVTTQC